MYCQRAKKDGKGEIKKFKIRVTSYMDDQINKAKKYAYVVAIKLREEYVSIVVFQKFRTPFPALLEVHFVDSDNVGQILLWHDFVIVGEMF